MNFTDGSYKMNTVDGTYFDTYNTITSPAPVSILKEAMGLCRYYNNLLSKTVPGSDVWNINHSAGETVNVSPHTAKIVRMGLEMNRASGGAFNFALAPVINLWRFTDGSAVIPEPQKIAEALSIADCSGIQVSDNSVTVPTGVAIDLGGIAKGYITDRIADALRYAGVDSALLNFGGNIVTVGCSPSGKPWIIGLQKPQGKHGQDFWAVVESVDSTLVTSGIYERFFVKDDRIYHHILDPRTGYPVQSRLLAVTAIAKDSLLADAITTALFVLGPEEGMKLAHRYGVAAVFLDRDNNAIFPAGLDIKIVKQN